MSSDLPSNCTIAIETFKSGWMLYICLYLYVYICFWAFCVCVKDLKYNNYVKI